MRPLLLSALTLAAAAAAADRPRVIFDVDLAKGSPGPGMAAGGVWDRGWRTTGAKDERIVFDAGRPVANGYLEVSLTIDSLPWAHQQGKINYAGLHEDPSLSQDAHGGDVFYARTGNEAYRFSNVKAAGRRFDRTEHEPRVGESAGWVPGGTTVHTIRLEWRDGVPVFVDAKGRRTVFPRDVVGGDTPVDRLRYAFIGSDRYNGLTVKGMRFLRVKLVDLGPAADGVPPPRLRISANGRWLADDTGRPVFLLADTAWDMAMRLRKEEIEEYLRRRRGQRFNTVAFVLSNPAKKTNVYGKAPFQLKEGRFDPARPAVEDSYDYWDHVDFAIGAARGLGMYAIVLPTWGSGVAGGYGGQETADIIFNTENAEAYGRWLGQRYGGNDHVIWMLGGDRSAVYGERDFRPVFRAMARGIIAGASREALISFHGRKLNPQSSEWFHDDGWLSFHSIQQWPEDQAAAVEHDWNLPRPKPSWLFEGRYEGYYKGGYQAAQWGEWQTRFQAWQTVFAGAFGHTYGHERVFSFGEDGWDWRKELAAPGARSMTHLARFVNSISEGNLLERVPGQSPIDGEAGKADRLTSDRITAMRTNRGNLAMFYSASGRPIRVRMDKLSGKPMNVWWFNPRNGCWSAGGTETPEQRVHSRGVRSGPGAPIHEFTPPGEAGPGRDWALVLSTGDGL